MPARVLGAALLLLAVATHLQTTALTQSTSERYWAQNNGHVVRLVDRGTDTSVSVIPSAGNLAVEMKIKGQNVLRFPYESAENYKNDASGSIGIPFLAPWADRLDEQAFYANGKRYAFDMELGNVRGANPIHGFLSSAEWTVIEAKADARSAWVTSRLEFFRSPAWMKQFPFAHTIDMTHRLQDGVLEVATRIENLSAEPMPVVIGFHPYFQLTDSLRDQWSISVGARTYWPMAESKMPTGERRPIEAFFADPQAVALEHFDIDNVFSDLVRDDRGQARMALQGKSQRLEVLFGPNYRAVVVYAPKPVASQNGGISARNFVCLEPVAGIINALNLAHKGLYGDLQSVQPNSTWRESFWIRPSGF